MKTLSLSSLAALAVFALFSFESQAQNLNPKTKVVGLKDGAKLKINNDLLLTDTQYGSHVVYHTHFDNGDLDSSTDVTTLGYTLDSGVTLRTNTRTAVIEQSGLTFLKAGTYCLSRGESEFESHTGNWGELSDYLYFRTCDSYEPAFILNLNAGYTLRNSETFHGFTLRDFNDQVSDWMHFVR